MPTYYYNYGALRKHLWQTHNFYTRKTNSAMVPSSCDEENSITTTDDNIDLPDDEIEPPNKKQRAEWILCTSVILDLTSVVKQKLAMHNATPELTQDLLSVLQSDTYNKPFKGLEAHYRQMKYLRESLNYVVSLLWHNILDNTYQHIQYYIVKE